MCENSSSSAASLESKILTVYIYVVEGQDIMCIDVPNAVIQSLILESRRAQELTVIKIIGVLVDFVNPNSVRPLLLLCCIRESEESVLFVLKKYSANTVT
jgi:hypothetical protein